MTTSRVIPITFWGSGTNLCHEHCQLMARSPQSHLTRAQDGPEDQWIRVRELPAFIEAIGATNSDLGRDAANPGNSSFFYGQTAYINCTMDTNIIISRRLDARQRHCRCQYGEHSDSPENIRAWT